MKARVVSMGVLAAMALAVVPAAARTSLSVAMWLNDPKVVKATTAVMQDYEKRTGVHIDLVYSDWNGYFDKLLALATIGRMPDVVVLGGSMLPMFAAKGMLRPMDAMVKADGLDIRKDLTNHQSAMWRGKFYGIPIYAGPDLYMYNPEFFTGNGLSDPNELVKAGKWDWDTLVEYGRKMTKDTDGDGKPDRFALQNISSWGGDWTSYIWQNGGDVVDDDYTKPLVDKPEAIGGLQFWADLQFRYNIAPQPSQGSPTFASRKAAMRHVWLTEAPQQAKLSAKFIKSQITLLPSGNAGHWAIGGGCPMTISANTRKAAEAYRFIKWYALESDTWRATSNPPSLRSAYDTEYQKFLAQTFDNVWVAKEAVKWTRHERIFHPSTQLLVNTYDTNLNKVIKGTMSAAQAAQQMAKEIQSILSRRK